MYTKTKAIHSKLLLCLSISYIALTFNIILSIHPVACSPPIDYFLFTGQANQQGASNEVSLPSLDSIYLSVNGESGDKSQHFLEISKRVLSLIQNTSHTHDNDMIDLETTSYAWHLMERQALLYMKNRVAALRSTVNSILTEANVSRQCHISVEHWLNGLSELDHWATIMWNSWGEFPPAGLFEGSFTDLGSYRGCLSVPDSELIGQAQYCTIDFQPLVPTRPRFHSIFKRVLDVDPNNNQLTSGDFWPDKISSRHSSHGFGSTKFKSSHQVQDRDRKFDFLINRYSKRTISQNGTEEPKGLQDSTQANTSLSLTAQAIIELARRAQYFYYVKFRLGACLPSKCAQDDVQKLAQAAGQRAILQTNHVNCMTKNPVSLNGYQKVAIWILSALALTAVLGTLVDILGFKGDSSSVAQWLIPFSMWTNSRKLFDSSNSATHVDLECIHGLRFISMVWVIYGHTVLYTEYQSFTHFYDVIERQIPSFVLLPFLNANFSVDTFFVIRTPQRSGMLTTYVTWEYTKGDARKFNKFAYAVSRYIRLTPQLAIVILCFFLLPLFGDGPMYKQLTEDKANKCYQNWAINLLYLQSYINAENMCIQPSWWLSIEMTFHLASLFVIMFLIKSAWQGMVVNFAMGLVLTLWGAVIHYSNGFAIQYLPSIPQRYEVDLEQSIVFFHRPYPHAASYFIGIALGYLLANRSIKKFTKPQVYHGWLICTIGLVMSLWGSYYWNLGAPYTQIQATIYYHICQIMWPLSIAWIILACSLSHGGIVESILSARCFVAMGRITYMTYLSHALVIYYHSASMNVPVEPSMLSFIYLFISNLFISFVLGIVLTVVYESPILNLQKQMFAYLIRTFDPSVHNPSSEPPTSLVCDKNGTSTASAMLLPNKLELINRNEVNNKL